MQSDLQNAELLAVAMIYKVAYGHSDVVLARKVPTCHGESLHFPELGFMY
jgi:hypothetical protein